MLNRRFNVKVMGSAAPGTAQQIQGLRAAVGGRRCAGRYVGKTGRLALAPPTCRLPLVRVGSLVRKTKNTTALVIMGPVVPLVTVTRFRRGWRWRAAAAIVTKRLRTDEAMSSGVITLKATTSAPFRWGWLWRARGLSATIVNG